MDKSVRAFEELRQKIEQLEMRQQTEVMSVEQERKLVAKISALRREFERMQKVLEQDKQLKELLRKAQSIKKEADKYHEEVLKYVKLSHECRDKISECYKEADMLREKADEAHRMFLDAQRAADEAHALYLKYKRDLRDFDKLIDGLRRKMRADWTFRERMEARKKLKDLLERFKEGKKLSTEDLMLFQRLEQL